MRSDVRTRRLLARALAGVLILIAGIAAAQTPLAIAIKATYLYKFAPFIEWPTSAFDSPSAPITICVVGQDPFDGILDQAVAGQRVAGRAIVVRRISTPSPACHIAFVAGNDRFVAESIAALRGAPVLTVTDSPSGPHGIINFVIDANHVRFDIDDDLARKSGLLISSKLLNLAHAVGSRG